MRDTGLARRKWMLPVLLLAWGVAQPLMAGPDKPAFWQKAVDAMKPGKGAKESAAAQPKVVPKELIGTWVGKQDGMPQALITLVLKKDNTFVFTTRLSPEALKQMPKGSKAELGSQKGTYSIDGDVLAMDDKGEAGMSKTWKMVDKVLVLDNVMRLKKTK
jgi:hypothetical protein